MINQKIIKLLSVFTVFCFVLISPAYSQNSSSESFIKHQTPDFPTFEELKILSNDPSPKGALGEKIKKLWRTPVIDNEAYYSGAKPYKPTNPKLGTFMRVASWNIEKSMNVDKAIHLFTSDTAIKLMIDPEKALPGTEEYFEILEQKKRLLDIDVLLLQEMEVGIKRSKYKDAAKEIAKALNMNYAYAPQYLEVDPVTLGIEEIDFEEGEVDKEAMDFYSVDQSKYKGVFGSAVLSKYPIKYVEIRPLMNQAYDWYSGEKEKVGFLEKTRRLGAKTVFKNEMTREIKVGGRGYFRVDLEVPDIPGGTLTIINVHLEIKCLPKGREMQMRELLSYIKDIKNPVIMMGDYNAAPTDISPTSVSRTVKRVAKNPTTWLGAAVNVISPHGLAINTTRGVSNLTKNFNDPFAKNIKVVAPNPLKPMFMAIKDFRFNDGGVFDFRGDPNRSIGHKDKLLANSNQRGRKGFKTTFSVKRALGIIGKYRLDWIFVKSFLKTTPEDTSGPYKLAPHFGETLEEMNSSLKKPISDHHPSVVDLPFEEPKI